MGIRIHKILGWGLQDVQHADYNMDDSRFHDLSEISEACWGKESILEFFKWIKENNDEAIDICHTINGKEDDRYRSVDGVLKHAMIEDKYHAHIMEHDAEYGMGNVFIICPPEYPDWYRYDDTIDYYDCKKDSDGSVNTVEEIECGIYPHLVLIRIPGSPDYDGELNDPRFLKNHLFPADYQMMTGRWTKTHPAPNPHLAEYLLTHYRPTIPDSVILWCHFWKIFKNFEKTIQEMRPLLYTYWG